MKQANLPDCLKLLRLLREPHTIACLARQTCRCEKAVRRNIARLRAMGFSIRSKAISKYGTKAYWAVMPLETFRRFLTK